MISILMLCGSRNIFKSEFYPCKPDIFERIYEPEAMCADPDRKNPAEAVVQRKGADEIRSGA